MTQSSIENGSNINDPGPDEVKITESTDEHGQVTYDVVNGETGEQTVLTQADFDAESLPREHIGVFVADYQDPESPDGTVLGSVEITIKASPDLPLQAIVQAYIHLSQPTQLAMLWNANADDESKMTVEQFEQIKYREELQMMASRDPSIIDQVKEMLSGGENPDADVPDERARRIVDNPQA